MIKKIPIRRLSCLTIGQLPTSYRESMSYEEQVLWLCNRLEKEIEPSLNEVIEILNNLDINFDEIYTEIDTIKANVSILQTELLNTSNQVSINSNNISLLNNKIDSEITNLNNSLTELINNNYNVLKDYIDYNDSILNDKIDNISTTGIMAYNPTNGLLEPLQKVLNDIAQATNKDGLTATEFDALELTATSFDAYQITAYEFDSQGKIILV